MFDGRFQRKKNTFKDIKMFDNVNWPTILISFFSSIIVSLFTFILGLRAGKNQNDRQKLKQSYKDLYSYFKSIGDGLKENEPVLWDDFKVEWRKGNKGYYLTPLREKELKGELIELDNRKTALLIKNEQEYLHYGYELKNKAFPMINDIILEELNKLFNLKTYQNDNSNNYDFFIEKRYGSSYSRIEVNPKIFLFEKDLTKLSTIEIKENQYFSFSMKVKEKNKTINIETRLFPDIAKFFAKINERVNSDEYLKKIKPDKEKLTKKCNKDIVFLRRRVKEPHTVVNTVLNSFIDIFRI
ncbi:MAG TPA: hypothetical protein DCL73_05105 [Treponema sp.]|nr:hypothetical protein [Treponema sp.]